MRPIDADVLIKTLGVSDEDIDFQEMLYEAPTIKTKQVKYFDEDEKVWKTGEVIVDGEREGE